MDDLKTAHELGRLLKASIQVEASDIHIKPGSVPMFRISGELLPVEFPAVETEQLQEFCTHISGRSDTELSGVRSLEFTYEWPGVARFRGHYYIHRGGPALALRPIPLEIPTMKDLRLPAASKRICELTHGLVLVTGATGMGKSTTLACLLESIAHTSCSHIITIEDPVEFAIKPGSSSVGQREVGRDVDGYDEGLRQALRQDPDVIMIGEIRDRPTMEVALHAAQSGHLVLSTAHFNDTTSTVNGVVAMAEPAEQRNWRFRLADSLRAIISQRLLRRSGSPGRVLATELLFNGPTIRACIQDENKTKSIQTGLERGRTEFMTHSMDQSLLELVEAKLINVETAQGAAASPGDLMREINLRRLV